HAKQPCTAPLGGQETGRGYAYPMSVGLLYPGEMGAAIGAALREPPVWARAGRSPATALRAAAFEDAGTLEALVAQSDVILCICPPTVAEDTAERVAEL